MGWDRDGRGKMAGMIRRLLLFSVVAVCPAAFAAKDTSAAQALLTGATHQASLLEDSPHPFELDVDFTAVINTPMQGHLKLRWEAKDRWWSRLTVGPFEQIKSRIGEKSYTVRNADFTPRPISDLFKLLRVAGDYGQLVVKKDK